MTTASIRTADLHDRPLRAKGGHGVRPYGTWLSLLRIDLRRAGGPWMLPFAILFAVLIIRNALTPGVAVWPEITNAIGMMALPLVAVAVVVGAYAGGRERRAAIAELSGGTAMVAWQRYLSVATSVFLWALALYALFAVALLAYGALFATWSGPEWGVIVVPIPALALGAAFGVVVGRIVKDRTAPIIAIALFLLLFAMPFTPKDATQPLNVFMLNGWFEPFVENPPERPFSVVAQLGWSLGLTGLLVGVGILWERRTAFAAVLPVLSLTVALVAASVITGSGYRQETVTGMGPGADMTSPVGSACDTSGAVVICVHPAYEPMLPDAAAKVNTYLAPVAGLEGVATEVYISSGNGMSGGWDQDGGNAFTSIDRSYASGTDALIAGDLWPMSFMQAPTNQSGEADLAQYVVMTALARKIGVDEWPQSFHRVPAGAADPAVHDAINRFAALSPDEQRTWLEANWDDLSHGRLTLEDLP